MPVAEDGVFKKEPSNDSMLIVGYTLLVGVLIVGVGALIVLGVSKVTGEAQRARVQNAAASAIADATNWYVANDGLYTGWRPDLAADPGVALMLSPSSSAEEVCVQASRNEVVLHVSARGGETVNFHDDYAWASGGCPS